MTRFLSNPKTFLAMAFLVGLGLGAWAMRFYFNRTLGSWDLTERFAVQMSEDLNLKADQKRKVTAVLTDQKRRMEDLRDHWRVDVRLLARQGEDQIAGVLSPEQLDVFMRLHDRIHGRMDRFLWTSETGPTAVALSDKEPQH
jgi:hypothetical protein